MTIFDAPPLRPPWKYRRLAFAIAAGVVIAAIVIFVLLRFHKERSTVGQMMNDVVAEDFQAAYKVWKPTPSYSFQDFMQDWGPEGYYGPIKSYQINNHLTEKVRGGGSVAITVKVSPFQPFPAEDDAVKQTKTKEVQLWVQFKDESISFPPPQ